MAEWLIKMLGLPADALKAIGTIAVGAILGLATYVVARIKEARRGPDPVLAMPRLALDPADRDLGYTLVRTATDLTRALNDCADALANLPSGGGGPAPAPAPPHHRSRRSRP